MAAPAVVRVEAARDWVAKAAGVKVVEATAGAEGSAMAEEATAAEEAPAAAAMATAAAVRVGVAVGVKATGVVEPAAGESGAEVLA